MARKKRKINGLTCQQILNMKSEVYTGIINEAKILFPAEYEIAAEESDKAIEELMEHAKNLPAFHLCDYLYWLQVAVNAHFIANEFNEYGVIIDGKLCNISDEG